VLDPVVNRLAVGASDLEPNMDERDDIFNQMRSNDNEITKTLTNSCDKEILFFSRFELNEWGTARETNLETSLSTNFTYCGVTNGLQLVRMSY
jgi:hypothetical protein